MAKPKLTAAQRKILAEIVEEPKWERREKIVAKIEKNDFESLTKDQWNKIFDGIVSSITYFSYEHEEKYSRDWYKELYSDTEKVMKYYHPTWKSPRSFES